MNDNGQAAPLLVAEQVRKVYRTGGIEVEALAGLDLVVRRGELVAVMGPSGSSVLAEDRSGSKPWRCEGIA